jgi:steroid delta-isomerase
MQSHETLIQAYVDAFVGLTPANADNLYALVTDDVFFSDPFNQITGKAGFKQVFDHMFETCESPRFVVSDIAHSGSVSYLRWQMTGRLKNWPHTALDFTGMTEVHSNANGKISHHIDHWDSASQLLQHLPVIGAFVRPILRLFRLKPTA